MATQTKADSSVVVALSELVRIEEDRMASDRAREAQRIEEARAERERVEAAAREAERQRAERAAQEARVAEAEARLRVEADRERDQRIAAMRAELARVEADRQAMRADLETRLTTREPARPSGWALAFGLSSLVAASLAGLLVFQQGAQHVALPASHTPVSVAVAAPITPHEVAVAAPPARTDVATVAEAAPAPRVHHRRDHDHTQVDDHGTSHGTDLVGLGDDDGGDDVLGPELARDAHRTLSH